LVKMGPRIKAFFETDAGVTVQLILLFLFIGGVLGFVYLGPSDEQSYSESLSDRYYREIDTFEKPVDPEYWR